MSEKITCPRRIENGMDVTSALRGSGPNLDTYGNRGGLIHQRRACSYCGSLPPDDFMEAVRAGAELGPTDKNYKVYIHSAEQKMESKFYFQHLSAEQQREFIQLLNDRVVKIGYPGYFPNLPFFIGRA